MSSFTGSVHPPQGLDCLPHPTSHVILSTVRNPSSPFFPVILSGAKNPHLPSCQSEEGFARRRIRPLPFFCHSERSEESPSASRRSFDSLRSLRMTIKTRSFRAKDEESPSVSRRSFDSLRSLRMTIKTKVILSAVRNPSYLFFCHSEHSEESPFPFLSFCGGLCPTKNPHR